MKRLRFSVSNVIAVLAAFWLGASCTGCVTVPGPAPVEAFNAQPLVPEEWFRLLHLEMEACLKIKRPYEDIRWFVVRPGVMDMPGETTDFSGQIAGRWSWPNKIFLDARYVWHQNVIKHEIAHYLLGLAVKDQHTDPRFLECTGIIT